MSVDVEEWFHIPAGIDNIITFDKWDSAPQRVQYVIPKILDLFEKNNVTATFFFLGWIAEKHPAIVKDTISRGHEIATHGYAHKLIYNQSRSEFNEDIAKAKSILENITGKEIIGYRAPGFSITPETEWVFNILVEHGFKYDSSIFPGKRFLGYYDKFSKDPVVINISGNQIVEFPQTLIDFGFIRLSCFGGGYLRLFPACVIKKCAKVILKTNRPLIIYIHPRDIDPDQPAIDFSVLKKFRHYVNISKTARKLDQITKLHKFKSFESVICNTDFLINLDKINLDTVH